MTNFEKGNMSSVKKSGNNIHRTKPFNYVTQRKFFEYLEDYNLNIPKYIGETTNEIILSYVDGDCIHEEIHRISEINKKEMIISSAKYLAEYHKATENFPLSDDDKFYLEYNGNLTCDVICHNDFAPYNITFNNYEAIGLIDFDTICPGPREWDIAYALYRFVFIDQLPKNGYDYSMNLFLNAYGYKKTVNFIPIIIERLEALINLISFEVSNNNKIFIEMEKKGHKQFYIEEIQRIKNYSSKNS